MDHPHPQKAEIPPLTERGLILQHLHLLSSLTTHSGLTLSLCSFLYRDSTWDPGPFGFLDNHPPKTEWPLSL